MKLELESPNRVLSFVLTVDVTLLEGRRTGYVVPPIKESIWSNVTKLESSPIVIVYPDRLFGEQMIERLTGAHYTIFQLKEDQIGIIELPVVVANGQFNYQFSNHVFSNHEEAIEMIRMLSL